MGICGKYADKFSEANLATCVDISMNADYPHCFFDVHSMDGKEVTLKSHRGGDVFSLKIRKDKSGREFVYLEQASTYEKIYKNGKPRRFKVYPFKGERI